MKGPESGTCRQLHVMYEVHMLLTVKTETT